MALLSRPNAEIVGLLFNSWVHVWRRKCKRAINQFEQRRRSVIHANLRPFLVLFLMTCHCLGDVILYPLAHSHLPHFLNCLHVDTISSTWRFLALDVNVWVFLLALVYRMDDSYLASSGERMQGRRDYDPNT